MNVVTTRRTPNTERRREPVKGIVVHATASGRDSALNWLTHPRSQVSAHALIDTAGTVYELASDDVVTWHAGRSAWQGETSLNRCTLGVELVNRNTGHDPYPAAQYAATVAWCQAKIRQYGIRPAWVVRHLDISPGRKTDPRGFPWQRFVSDLYPVAPTPGLRSYRVAHAAWLRSAPDVTAPQIGTLLRGAIVAGTVVRGGAHAHPALGVSDRWLRETATGGYVWLPQVEAL